MRTVLMLASALLLAGPAIAQGRPDEPRPPRPADRAPEDPQEAARLLERRIEDTQKRQDRMRDALRKIREGVPAREALKDIDLRPDNWPDSRFDRHPPGKNDGRSFSERERERHRQPTTPEQRAHAKAFLRAHLPSIADRFDAVEKSDPQAVEGGYSRLVPRVADAEALIERDPELFRLKLAEIEGTIHIVEAIRAFREADAAKDPARITQTRAALREALSRQMDTRIELQVREVNALAKQLEDLKTDLEQRRTNRESNLDAAIERIRTYRERQEREGARPGDRAEKGENPPPRR
jgi:hypothetical protein